MDYARPHEMSSNHGSGLKCAMAASGRNFFGSKAWKSAAGSSILSALTLYRTRKYSWPLLLRRINPSLTTTEWNGPDS